MRAIRKRPAKGLLAGLYELPNLSGWLSQDEVLDWLKQEGLSPIRIRRLLDAKHIFSHIEWHMTGYVVSGGRTGKLFRKRYAFY